MCGIFGVLWHKVDSIPDEYCLKETACLLHHRGPDSEGIYADAGVGLVHTRLSLLDLNPRSNQPFWDKQGRYCLVYNGEIYNFKALRAELEQWGIQFRTTSDTEVLLEQIINCGVEAALPKLEGMFAFALYDKVEKTLVLARDRFGIKPLLIYDEDDAFIFASEIQAMRPWIKLEPDLLSISSYLYGFRGPTKGYSFFNHIKFLPPGVVVKVRLGQRAQYSSFFSLKEFWDQDQADQLSRLKPQQIVDQVEELLLHSVQQQLFADAPVGALCSGGVDSSLIMAMAAKFHNKLAIFHANVAGPLSEHEAAVRLAKHLKLDLKTADVYDQDFIDQLPEVVEHYGHPFYVIPSSIPFFMVSKLVRSNDVKAVLSGEGSDEIYLGYRFLVPDVRKWRRYAPKIFKELLKKFIIRREADRRVTLNEWDTYSSRQVHLSPERLVMGLHNRFEVALEAKDLDLNTLRTNGSTRYNNSMISVDLLNYNLRALLHRNDTMGMAASIEARFPFLDCNLVKYAVNMPYNYKIRFSPHVFDQNHYFFSDKWVLRQVADRYLPHELSHRPKGPFPVDAFQRSHISPAFFETSFIADLFGLSKPEISYLVDNADHDLKIKMMHLEAWAHVCLFNLPKSALTDRLREHITVTAG